MKHIALNWHDDWPHAAATSPCRIPTFVQRYGRRRVAYCNTAPAQAADNFSPEQLHTTQKVESVEAQAINTLRKLECPACTLRAQMDDFESVRIDNDSHVHCPGCDANLGLPEHALRHAA